MSGKKRLPPYPGREDLDYSERYAVEPTVNMRLPSLKKDVYVGCCNKVFFFFHFFVLETNVEVSRIQTQNPMKKFTKLLVYFLFIYSIKLP